MYKIVNKSLKALAFVGALMTASQAASAQTIKVLIVQDDSDKSSLFRNGRIQSAVLNVWNQTMNGPAYQQIMRQYGITGTDVYDENAITLLQYEQNGKHRRPIKEVIQLSRQIKNPPMDVLISYALYAQAIKDPYTRTRILKLSMNYRALRVQDGRYLGGGNLDLDTHGVIITGCAAGLHGQPVNAHCVNEFVAGNAERLTRVGANKLALQLAALLGQKYGQGNGGGYNSPTNANKVIHNNGGGYKDSGNNSYNSSMQHGRHKGCDNLPATFKITYSGFANRQISFIEGNMQNWKCKLNLNITSSDFGTVSFEYKTRSNQQRLLRNIRMMSELMGIVIEAQTNGRNGIVVKSLALRQN